MMLKFLLIFVTTSNFCTARHSVNYNNYKVYRVTPSNVQQLRDLQHMENDTNNRFDFWTFVTKVGNPVDIMVSPNLRCYFKNWIRDKKLHSRLIIKNVQKLINSEKPKRRFKRFDWKNYQPLKRIYAWLKFLSRTNPRYVKIIKGGRTYEKRQILGIRITFKPGNKGVFLEGGIHAREWISPATLTYIAKELLTNTDPAVRAVAESRDWYIFPVINPDGYVFTFTADRMWRKNRKPYGRCYGTDLNRNWGYKWMHGGSSSSSCLETFAGARPFSEIETSSLSNYISTIAKNLDGYISFHSYGQMLLIPFGHDGYEKPANNKELLTIGKKAIKKLAARYGTLYKVGNIPDMIIGVASGSSVDWALGTYRHIRLAYAFELRDGEKYGFILPRKQIIPTGQETFDAIVSIFQQANNLSMPRVTIRDKSAY